MKQKSLAILLAVYEPRIDWLIELLDSLNAQTYPNLRLYVRNDASPTLDPAQLAELLQKHVTNFPYTLRHNEQNLGSNETFAKLICDSREHYVAFCDQDDIWNPDKIANSVRLLEESDLSPRLVCTNVSVINGKGKKIASRMEKHRRRHVFLRGKGLAPSLIYRNFVMGCTVVCRRDRALDYLPFPREIVHDHWLAFLAASEGAIDYLAEPQMRYRVYGGNQTGVMTGVSTKEDYLNRRILVFDARVRRFSERVSIPELDEALAWSEARVANFHRKCGGFRALWRMRHVNKSTSLFELFALRMPTPIFRFLIRLVQRGKL